MPILKLSVVQNGEPTNSKAVLEIYISPMDSNPGDKLKGQANNIFVERTLFANEALTVLDF